MIKNKVTVIGLGYVGLPLACAIAETKKYKVFGFDVSKEKIKLIKEKKSPIKDEYLDKTLKKVNITVSDNDNILKESEYIIICVPTPVYKSKLPDLKPLIGATKSVLKYLEKGQKIIIESTINPGVCEDRVLPILEKTKLKGGKDFELSHCPERINPGDLKWNVKNIPRNLGSLTKKGNRIVADFYRTFIKAEINEVSGLKVAESTKVIENTFRDINIAYVNELAKSFDKMGIDLLEVLNSAKNKPFSFMVHYPGCGVGGHCIPVDPYYLIEKAKKSGFNHSFLKKARQVNNSMPHYTVELLKNKLNEAKIPLKNAKVGLLGLAYKADVDDIRESPSMEILEILKREKMNVQTFDPNIIKLSDKKTFEELLSWANCLVLATGHSVFKKITGKLLKKYDIKIIIDGKNILDKEDILKNKVIYKGIGH